MRRYKAYFARSPGIKKQGDVVGRPKKEKPNHGGLYEVKATIGKGLDGKLIRKSFYSPVSKRDARQKADEYLAQKRAAEITGIGFAGGGAIFDDYTMRWLETFKKGKVKDNTYRGTYENPVLKHLIPYFGKAQMNNIKQSDVQKFFDEKGREYSLETLKKMRSTLNLIFIAAIDDDLCYKNPVNKNIKLQSSVSPAEKSAYTQAEYNIVWDFARSHRFGLSIMVMMETGISRSELLGITRPNIDFDNNIIYITDGLVEEKSTETDRYVLVAEGLKNKYRARPIPISGELSDALKNKPTVIYIGGNAKKSIAPVAIEPKYVFHSPTGGPYSPNNWYKREYSVFMDDLQKAHPEIKRLTPHELRHTRATLSANDDDVDLFQLAKLLGHSDLNMLIKRYAHTDVEAMRKALKIGDKDG